MHPGQQAPCRKPATESSQAQAVGRDQPWSLDVAAKDGDLVAQGEQLEATLGLGSGANHEDVHHQSHQGVDGREEHEPGA